MNSADHAGTFSALVAYLREQVRIWGIALSPYLPSRWLRGLLCSLKHAFVHVSLLGLPACMLLTGDSGCRELVLCEAEPCLQGCHAGLLQHQDLAANKGISNALNSIMRQFSGLDTEACDMEAIFSRIPGTTLIGECS